VGFPLSFPKKKRGRKEVSLRRKGTVHGFRILSVYTIQAGFERVMTQMKIILDEIMNMP
jgi:hypothetical protein